MSRTKQGALYKVTLIGLLGIAFALACERRITPPRLSAADEELKVIGPWEIPTLDPLGAGAQFLRMQVTETLVDARPDGSLIPGLATSWTASADGLEWRFHIRPNSFFHNGSPVTAQAAVMSLQRARVEPGTLSLAAVSGIRAEGNDVIIALTRPSALVPALLAHASTQILSPASFDAEGRVVAVIGTGPYRIKTIEQPQYFAATAFAQWQGAAPAARDISYLSVSRSETRALMAEAGQADLVFNLDPASLSRIRKRSWLAIKSVTIPRTISVKLNAGNPCFADARTRHAISLTLNRAGVARTILRDPEMAATQLLPPILHNWYNPNLPALHMDRAEAVRLLEAAGWRRTNKNMFTLGGSCETLELRAFPDRPELPLLASVVQEEMRQIGLTVRVNIGNSGDIPAGHRDGSLMMGLIARNYGMVPDPAGTLALDFQAKGADWGAMNWSNPEVSSSLDALIRNGDSPQAAALRQRVTEDLQEGLPVIPLVWYRQTVVTGQRILDIPIDPFERSYRLTELKWANRPAGKR